jgi:predicted nucleic acid-binding protein
MSKLILDACVALKMIFVSEEGADLALSLREDFKHQIHQLIAPDILPVEMAHAVTRAERKGIIPKGKGQVLLNDFLTPCPNLFTYGDLLDRAMELSSDVRLGVYDCLYVALAEEENCKIVTVDQKMIDLFPQHVISLSDV